MDTIILVPGQRLRLNTMTTSSNICVELQTNGIEPRYLRPVCLCLDTHGYVIDGKEAVYSGRTQSRCGGIRFRSEQSGCFDFFLDKVSTSIDRIVITLGLVDPIHNSIICFETLQSGSVKLKAANQLLAVYDFKGSDFIQKSALCVIEIYRKEIWRLCIPASGFIGGIPVLLSQFHVNADMSLAIEKGIDSLPVINNVSQNEIILPKDWPGSLKPKIPKGLVNSVGLIVVEDDSGNTGTGTGFIISPGGFLLTCAHVVKNAHKAGIAIANTHLLRELELVEMDDSIDVALLYIKDRNGCESWLVFEVPENESGLGDHLGMLGYPLGVNLGFSASYSEGIINSIRPMNQCNVFQIDAGAAPGSSGSPVFNRDSGKVIGMLSRGISLQQGGMLINFALDIRILWKLGWFTKENS
ncbi:MAG: trypsin-like peptidase domain-containing protein [Desulfobacterales bacterium]|nr:trypsin-like peptidase domain-containing protein [Desulfobacterales bacterium]